MSARSVTQHVFRVSLTMVNVFLIVLPDGITMIDAGVRRSFPRIAKAIKELGRRPEDVTDILVTHLHGDHTGGLAEAHEATGAQLWMHAADAFSVAAGESNRPMKPTPGTLSGPLFGLFSGLTSAKIGPVEADNPVSDRQEIPVAGGTFPIFTPGHTVGHVAYLWPRDGRVLFVGDAAVHNVRLAPSPVYEDYEQGVRSLRQIAELDFQVACFAHGRPITERANAAFREKWGRL